MKNRKILRFTGLPFVGPDRLDRGPDAHAESWVRARKALELPADAEVIDA